jgi:hypothetical protein
MRGSPVTGRTRPNAEPNKAPKYVAARTLTDPLDWQNATVLKVTSSKRWRR